jgi:type IV pilus assembly protein PilF
MSLMNMGCATIGQDGSGYLNRSGASPADIYIKLGVGYMARGNDGAALDNLNKAIKADADSSRAQGVIAVLYEKLKEPELAERHFKRALSLEPGNSSAHNNYGRFLCKRGQYREAAQHFERAYENPLYTKQGLALLNAGECELAAGNIDKAETLFRRALEIAPKTASALLNMAKIRFKKGNYLSVRAYLQRFREVSYHNAESLWMGIQAEHELGQQDAVAGYVITLHSKFPDSEEMKMLEEKFPQYR